MRALFVVGISCAILIAGNHQNQKRTQTADVQQASQYANPESPAHAQSTPAVQQENCYQKAKSYLKRAFGPEYLASWILVLAAGAGIYATFRTLGILQEQTEATKIAAFAARDNIALVVNKERARLDLGMRGPPVMPGEDWIESRITYGVRCYGTTPAYIGQTYGWAVVSEEEQPRPEKDSYLAMLLPPTLIPSIEETRITMPLAYNPLAMGTDIAERVAKRELFVHFNGVIEYTDIFGGRWQYGFRYFWFVHTGGQGQWVGHGKEIENTDSDKTPN